MRYFRSRVLKGLIAQVVFVNVILFLCLELTGCESFGRKFTRKKKEPAKPEEMVLAPEDYTQQLPNKEELYRQYYIYWQSWQDELIDSLAEDTNRKKAVDCISEAIKNFDNMKRLLREEIRTKAEGPVKSLAALKEEILKDEYLTGASSYIQTAERLRREIAREFSFDKIEDYLQ
jgi:hypothetical protein